jgi:Associated with zinc fingers.
MERGFNVTEVTNMVSGVTRRPMPMFKVTLGNGPASLRIEDVNRVGLHKVKIEPFERNRQPPRCSTCQNRNHTAGRYKVPPKCRTCSKDYRTQN